MSIKWKGVGNFKREIIFRIVKDWEKLDARSRKIIWFIKIRIIRVNTGTN